MNYLKEINTFWKIRQVLEVSVQAGFFYLFLLHKFNVKRWPESVFMTDQQAADALDLDRRTVSKISKELTSIGFIEVSRGGRGHRKSEYFISYPSEIAQKLGTQNVRNLGTQNVRNSAKLGTQLGTNNVRNSEDILYIDNINNKHSYINDTRLVKKSSNSFNQKKEKKPSPSCAAPLPLELQERHKVVFSLFDFPDGVLPQSDLYLMQFEAYEALVHEGYLTYVMDFARWAAGGWKKKDYTKELSRFRSHTNNSKRNGLTTQKINYASIDYSKGFDD